MKKMVAVILAIGFCICLSACAGQEKQDTGDMNMTTEPAENLSVSQGSSDILEGDGLDDAQVVVLTGGELYAPDFEDGYEIYVEESYTLGEEATHTLWRVTDDILKEEIYSMGSQIQCYRERSGDSMMYGTGEILPCVYFVTENYGYSICPMNWSEKTLATTQHIIREELDDGPCFLVYRVALEDKPSSLSSLEYTRLCYMTESDSAQDSLNGDSGYGWFSVLPQDEYDEWIQLLESAGSNNCVEEGKLEGNSYAMETIWNAMLEDMDIIGGELYESDFENGYKVFIEDGYDFSGSSGSDTHFVWEVTDITMAEQFLTACGTLECYLEPDFLSEWFDSPFSEDIFHEDPTIYLLTENYGYTICPLYWENDITVLSNQIVMEELGETPVYRVYRDELSSNGLTESASALEEILNRSNGDSTNRIGYYGWYSTTSEEIYEQFIALLEQVNDTNSNVIMTLPEENN